jgi:hypothetical protein
MFRTNPTKSVHLWGSPELSGQNDLLQERDKFSQECFRRILLSRTLNSFADIMCDVGMIYGI